MKVGTKSVLFGAHQFILHPLLMALAWWRLYGFPADPRLWVAFVVHDLGYIGKPNMDGPEGETHVELGARIMGRLFGPKWHDFCLYHSRFYAKRAGRPYSRLCVADKLVIALEPWWLYLPRAWASGELSEYMAIAAARETAKYAGMGHIESATPREWHRTLTAYMRRWVAEHKDGQADTVTLSAHKVT
jgi:hypothetical protein